ncbi:uncharacterized protein LOC105218044 [Zeugodacus cucurbitae]|nr:uncharacterized protein LOC105218044 [Zeugodacus cucurbitae]
MSNSRRICFEKSAHVEYKMHYGIFGLCSGLLLLVGGSLTEASVGYVDYYDDAHPGKCTISEKIIISPGETAHSPDICGRLTCENEKGLTQISSCGAVDTPDGCEWGDPVKEKATYPECCERQLICN